MLRTPSILGPLNSGFVAFDSDAPIDALADAETGSLEAHAAEAEATEIIARVAAAPMVETFEHTQRPVWAPANSARIRVVEALVVAAICGYFGFGLLRALTGA